jgi:D-alanyl-D-alanine carboxypeptidase
MLPGIAGLGGNMVQRSDVLNHGVRGLAWAVAALVLLAALAGIADAAPRATSMVVDYDTGAVLYADDADEAVFPASLTKTMTLYLVFEALRDERLAPSSAFKVSRRAASMPPSKLGLRAGSTITVKDAVLALITKSANDAAVVIAENMAGSEDAFAERMTLKARALGMTRTQFRNASGLPNSSQRTTARDMVRLGMRMINDFPEYYGLFNTREFRFRGRTYRNHNGLLYRYPGSDGMKTGFIQASGFNLLSSALRGDRRVVAAVFGGRSARARDNEMIRLLDRGFKNAPAEPLVASSGKLDDAPKGPDYSETLVASIPAPRPTLVVAQGDVSSVASPVRRSKPVVKSATRSSSRAASKVRARYAVQVGAFGSKSQARKAANSAAHKAPKVLAGRKATVKPINNGRRTLYRAWLVGLTAEQAAAACRQLKRADHACLVVRT